MSEDKIGFDEMVVATMNQFDRTLVKEERLAAAMRRFDQVGPLPGMIAAFETRFGQKWTDPDWRQETSIWAAAWAMAVARTHHQKDYS